MVLSIGNEAGSAVANIHLFGATVISWAVDGEQQLFVSGQSLFDETKAIRGGIPIVFPQFGPGPMKQHGFARVSRWTVEEQCADSAVLSLSEDALSAEWRALFPFLFRLEHTVKVTASKELSTS